MYVYWYYATVCSNFITSMSGAVVHVLVMGDVSVTVDVTADPKVLVLVEKGVARSGNRLVDSGDISCKCGIVILYT